MVPGHITIPITRAPIMLLRQQAITLRAIMAHSPVKARPPTAAAASGHTIGGQEPISGQTDTVTRAPKPREIYLAGPRPPAGVEEPKPF
jgi:hypothetical protein